METISDVEELWEVQAIDLVGKIVDVYHKDNSFKAEFLSLFKDERGDWNAVVRIEGELIDMVGL